MTKPTEFAERLSRLGITQAEASRVLHRSRETIAKWKSGRTEPDPMALGFLDVIEHAQGVIKAVRRQAQKPRTGKTAK